MLAKHYDAIPSDDAMMMSRSRRAPSNPPRRTSRVFFFCEYQIEHEQHRVIVCDGMRGIFSRVWCRLDGSVVVVVVYVVRRWRIVCDDDDDERRRKRRHHHDGAEHFSYPLNSDRRTYKGKSNEVYFNGQKYEKSKWKNGLIDTESVPYETAEIGWRTHPKDTSDDEREFRRGARKNFRNSGRAIKKVAAKEERRRSVRF